ncbi:MAG: hypothetical protein ACLUD4_00980 [Thomasclavelia spiroformis]
MAILEFIFKHYRPGTISIEINGDVLDQELLIILMIMFQEIITI